jgi:hypothetical protein
MEHKAVVHASSTHRCLCIRTVCVLEKVLRKLLGKVAVLGKEEKNSQRNGRQTFKEARREIRMLS